MIDTARVRVGLPASPPEQFVVVRRGFIDQALREIEAGRRAQAMLAAIEEMMRR